MIAKNLIEWRRIVLERDKVCQICGSSENLTADHIVAKRASQELSLDTDNGRMLCRRCHLKNGSRVLAKRHNRNSVIQIGGSQALILPSGLSVGAFATVVDIGPIIIVDPKGKRRIRGIWLEYCAYLLEMARGKEKSWEGVEKLWRNLEPASKNSAIH